MNNGENSGVLSEIEMALMYYDLGRKFASNRQYPEALDAFQKALQCDPSNPEFLDSALLSAMLSKNFEVANRYAEVLLNIIPDHQNAFIVKGLYHKWHRDLSRAAHCFRRVLLRDPGNAVARKHLSVVETEITDAGRKVKRRHERIPVRLGMFINYTDNSRYSLEKLITLSLGGGFVQSESPVEIGERLQFMLPIEGSKKVNGTAEVVWTGRPGLWGYAKGFAIKFDHLGSGDLTLIRRYLKTSAEGSRPRAR